MNPGAKLPAAVFACLAMASSAASAAQPETVLGYSSTTPGGTTLDMSSAAHGPRLDFAVRLPQSVFETPVQREPARPLLMGDKLWVGTSREAALLIYDAATGVLLDRIETRSTVESSPVYDAETNAVYVADTEGVIYRYTVDGESVWTYDVKEVILTTLNVHDGWVYFRTTTDQVGVVRASDGEWLWSYGREAPVNTAILGGSRVLALEDLAFAGFADGTVTALRRADGTVEWEIPLSNPGANWLDTDVISLVDDNCLFVSAYSGPTMCLNPATGSIQWTRDLAALSEPLVLEDRLIFSSLGGSVHAVSRQTGDVLWTWQAPKPINDGAFWRQNAGPTAVWQGQAIFATSRGYIYGLNPADGTQSWVFKPWLETFGFYGAPAIGEDTLFLVSGGGFLYGLHSTKPQEIYQTSILMFRDMYRDLAEAAGW